MRNLTSGARLAACVCLLLLAAGAAHAKAWRGVVPLRTTRAQVERRLGKPNKRNRHYEYPAERAFIVYASGQPCGTRGVGWDVPRDTVVHIVVTPKVTLPFSALRLDMRKFKKTADPEAPSHALYTNEREGITYRVSEGEGTQPATVLSVRYEPAASQFHRRCAEEQKAVVSSQ